MPMSEQEASAAIRVLEWATGRGTVTDAEATTAARRLMTAACKARGIGITQSRMGLSRTGTAHELLLRLRGKSGLTAAQQEAITTVLNLTDEIERRGHSL